MNAKIDRTDLGYEEEIEENGFIELGCGSPVASFDFSENLEPEHKEQTNSVSNEAFDIKRTYKIRESTAKMLNEIKEVHLDINVYMNTIVDAAIRHYHDFIFHNKECHKK